MNLNRSDFPTQGCQSRQNLGTKVDRPWGTKHSNLGASADRTWGNMIDRPWGTEHSNLGANADRHWGNMTDRQWGIIQMDYGNRTAQGYESSIVANAGPQRPLLDQKIKPRYQQMRAFDNRQPPANMHHANASKQFFRAAEIGLGLL